jgi:hypothetical protein
VEGAREFWQVEQRGGFGATVFALSGEKRILHKVGSAFAFCESPGLIALRNKQEAFRTARVRELDLITLH